MKIGIDARTLSVDGGSKTYALNLLTNISNKEDFILFGIENFLDYKCVPDKFNQQSRLYRLYYDTIKLPKLIKNYKLDIFHGLKNVAPKVNKVKTIITVHDIHIFKHPKFASLTDFIYGKYIYPRKIAKADEIISVSESTKKDLIEELKISSDKISVIYESYDESLYKINDDKIKIRQKISENIGINLDNRKIILNVNTISPRKNIQGVIKAFNIVASVNKDVILVVAGRNGWKMQSIYKEFTDSPYKSRIHFIGFVDNQMIADLYNISEVFVYPSFYEGFGLPILEAQACGCPVITSSVSSMPEVAGNSAILVDPYQSQDIASAIKNIVENDDLRLNLIKNGFKNCLRFSWKRCSDETLNIYKKIYG